MTILHSVDKEKNITLTTWIGNVDDSEMVSAYKKLYEDPDWKPGFDEIADMRNANLKAITEVGLLELHQLVRSQTEGKCDSFKTIIVASDQVIKDLAEKYKAFDEDVPEELFVFEDLQEAYKFLRKK